MNHFTKKDFYFSLITGLYAGLIVYLVFDFLKIPELFNIPWPLLIVIMPVVWILGINLGYFLGRWMSFFSQFGRFAAIGLTNAAVFFGVLNLFIIFSEINKGIWYSVFVASAFTVGTIHSYFWNKYWVFQATKNGVSGEEFGKFAGVAIIAGLINVGIASFVVNVLNPVLGLTLDQWANMGGVVGSASALIVSFVGFKLVVFKK